MTTKLDNYTALEMLPIVLKLHPIINLTDDEYYEFCQLNENLRIERTAKGELVIMAPTGGESGIRNAELTADFVAWNRQTKLGVVFDSSTGFRLPKGSDRSPDVSWIKLDRWNTLTPQEKKSFPSICPDFVLELRSETDSTKVIQDKMQEYLESGIRLGWLIDPKTKRVEIYRCGNAEVEISQSPISLSGEDVLPGFVLNLQFVFS